MRRNQKKRTLSLAAFASLILTAIGYLWFGDIAVIIFVALVLLSVSLWYLMRY